MAAPNFTLITELQTLTRRDFPLATADAANLAPLAANALVDGEWLELNSSYQLTRGTGEGANPAVYPLFVERGRYDTQAISKVTVLMLGMYEAETIIADTTSMVVGSAITVNDVTIGGVSRRAVKLKSGSSAVSVVGFVTKTYTGAGAGGRVRFVHYGVQYVF